MATSTSGPRPRCGRPVRPSRPDPERRRPTDTPDADPESVARAIVLRQLTMAPRSRAAAGRQLGPARRPGRRRRRVLDRFDRGRPDRRRRVRGQWVRRGTRAGWPGGRSPTSCAARASTTSRRRGARADRRRRRGEHGAGAGRTARCAPTRGLDRDKRVRPAGRDAGAQGLPVAAWPWPWSGRRWTPSGGGAARGPRGTNRGGAARWRPARRARSVKGAAAMPGTAP